MDKPEPIYGDVDGAPFKIGDVVYVVSLSDETADAEFLGRIGSVFYFDYTCGCGQTFPNDPMIGVNFGAQKSEFWKEELATASDGDH
jgi:hypothetical protein